MRYAQLVMGPAGSGKSKYCTTVMQHAENCQRIVNVINLDPAAEYFEYNPVADIRDLIHLDDVMEDEELSYGPNGGLVYCMEYLLDNLEWLEENIGDYEDDYLIFDCPGQLELYTHLDIIKNLIKALNNWNFRVCGVFLMDAQFMVEGSKFLSGTMSALSVMVNLEIPHVNILSKMDLLDSETRKNMERFLIPDSKELMLVGGNSKWNNKYLKLIEAIGKLIDDYSMVRFLPLDISDDESIEEVLLIIDNAIQYGEDLDVKTHEFDLPDDDDDS